MTQRINLQRIFADQENHKAFQDLIHMALFHTGEEQIAAQAELQTPGKPIQAQRAHIINDHIYVTLHYQPTSELLHPYMAYLGPLPAHYQNSPVSDFGSRSLIEFLESNEKESRPTRLTRTRHYFK